MRLFTAVLALLLAAPALVYAGPDGAVTETAAGIYRIQVDRVSVLESRTLEGARRALTVQRSCALTLRIEAATTEDAQALAGIAPGVRARDDTGLRLAARGLNLPGPAAARAVETRQTVLLEAPDRRATRLLTVDGELLLYRTVTPVRAEFDLTAGAPSDAGERTELLGNSRITLQSVELSGADCTLRLRIEGAPGSSPGQRAASLQHAVPTLLTRSGAAHRTGSYGSTHGVAPDGTAYVEHRLAFRGLKEPPAKLVYEAVLKSDPDRRIAFHLADVPLPAEIPTFSAGSLPARPAARDPAVRAIGPLAAPNGGGIASPVRLGAASTARGRVSFGLSRQETSGWSAVRWIDAPTDPSGIARLTGLQPGRYRIRRAFTPTGASAPLPGPWRSDTVIITLLPGKETALPPLERLAK